MIRWSARFTGMDTPACGFSIGFERIVGILMDDGFKVPGQERERGLMYEKGMGMERLSEILKAMAARAEGKLAYGSGDPDEQE